MWLIIASHIGALVAGFLLGVAFQLARDSKILAKVDASCDELVEATEKTLEAYRVSNKRLIEENQKLRIKLGGNAENESVQSSAEVLPLSSELSET